MSHRREFLLGTIGAGVLALAGARAKAVASSTHDLLRQTVGEAGNVAGMIAVVADESGSQMTSYGSSGVAGLALDADTVIEIGSITKVMTALLLADMVARGEVAFDDPVSKHLPRTMTLRERGRPITLLDLANYHSGLAKLPDNIPPQWWTNPNPFAHYTVDKLHDFLSSYEPEYPPRTHFEYSSLGFGLLGIALSDRAGKSYEELLIERVCNPLGLAHTRITLSADMKGHLAQAHDRTLKPTPLWDFLAPLQGAGAVRASVRDVTVFLKACMGIVHAPLSGSLARLVQTRSPTPLSGTDSGLGWFISSNGQEEIAWKSGLTGGFNSFLGFSVQRRRGAFVVSNFLWPPVDLGITAMGLKLISPGYDPGDLGLLYG